jgi:hypothetical protein
MAKGALIAVALIVGAMSALAYRGVTFQIACNWCEERFGLGSDARNLQSIGTDTRSVFVPGR